MFEKDGKLIIINLDNVRPIPEPVYGEETVLPDRQLKETKRVLQGHDLLPIAEKLSWHVPAPVDSLGFLAGLLLDVGVFPDNITEDELEQLRKSDSKINRAVSLDTIKLPPKSQKLAKTFPALSAVNFFSKKIKRSKTTDLRKYYTDCLKLFLKIICIPKIIQINDQ